MSTTTLELHIPPDEPVIEFSRFVKAPPELVFHMWTKAEHLQRWWGPRALELDVKELDVRVGGTYHFVHRAPDGQEFAFRGEFREVDPPHRLVLTFVFEGAPDAYAIDTLELEPVEGGTMIHSISRHHSIEGRDMHVANGMELGMNESMQRMDELLAFLQKS
jgi:uncharacterized protein YndB with AHSA1/START domain